jgi:hypothetical protein
MGESTPPTSLFGRIIGGTFAAIIAPTLTGVAVWFIQKKLDDEKRDLIPNPPVQAGAVPTAPAPSSTNAAAGPAPKVVAAGDAPAPSATKEAVEPSPKVVAEGSAAASSPAKDSASPPPKVVAVSTAPASSPAKGSAGVPPKVLTGPDVPAPGAAKAKAKPKDEAKDVPKPVFASTSTSSSTAKSAASPALPKKKALRPRLFNGKDLIGFEPYVGTAPGEGGKATGRTPAPEALFFVRDGELHLTGKVWGGLLSVREYENYHLVVEYKWGDKKWPPREDLPRMSGIVLHATGPPGAVRNWTMAGITCVIGEVDTGALLLPDALPKPISLKAPAERLVFKKGANILVYKPGEPLTTVQSGTLHRLGYRPPAVMAKAAAAGRVAKDLINPVGEWNKLECTCEEDRITVAVNGTIVNVATKVTETRGKLFIESQGAEISFRTITLRPLPSSVAPVSGKAQSTTKP